MSEPEIRKLFVEDRLASGAGFAGAATVDLVTAALEFAGFEILRDDSSKGDAHVVVADTNRLQPEALDKESCPAPLFLIDPVLSVPTAADAGMVPGKAMGVAYCFAPKAKSCGHWITDGGSPHYLSPFINPEAYFAAQRNSATLRQILSQKHHLPAESSWVFLSIRGDSTEESLLAIFEGLARLPQHNWSLVVSTESKLLPLVEQLLPRLSGVERYLPPANADTERRSFMATSDVFLAPDRRGDNVFDVLEALASGLAVVASKGPVIEEVVENGRSGRLSLPGNPSSLLNNLTFLLRHNNFLQSHKDNCRSQVVARHDILIAAQGLRRLIAPTAA